MDDTTQVFGQIFGQIRDMQPGESKVLKITGWEVPIIPRFEDDGKKFPADVTASHHERVLAQRLNNALSVSDFFVEIFDGHTDDRYILGLYEMSDSELCEYIELENLKMTFTVVKIGRAAAPLPTRRFIVPYSQTVR